VQQDSRSSAKAGSRPVSRRLQLLGLGLGSLVLAVSCAQTDASDTATTGDTAASSSTTTTATAKPKATPKPTKPGAKPTTTTAGAGASTTTTAAGGAGAKDPSVPPYTGTGPTFAMIGSSVSWRASGTIAKSALAAGYSASVSAVTDGSGWAKVPTYAATKPKVLLIEYGNNNPYDTFQKDFATVNAAFPSTCVVWVTMQDRKPVFSPKDTEGIEWNANQKRMNELIRTAPHVADWEAEIVKSLDAKGVSPLLGPDQIHPTTEENAAHLAKFEWDAVVRECGEP